MDKKTDFKRDSSFSDIVKYSIFFLEVRKDFFTIIEAVYNNFNYTEDFIEQNKESVEAHINYAKALLKKGVEESPYLYKDLYKAFHENLPLEEILMLVTENIPEILKDYLPALNSTGTAEA